jgi:DNA repair ATPase RecN
MALKSQEEELSFRLQLLKDSETYLNTAKGLEEEYIRYVRLMEAIEDIERDPEALSQSLLLQTVLHKMRNCIGNYLVITQQEHSEIVNKLETQIAQLNLNLAQAQQEGLYWSEKYTEIDSHYSFIRSLGRKLKMFPEKVLAKVKVSYDDLDKMIYF